MSEYVSVWLPYHYRFLLECRKVNVHYCDINWFLLLARSFFVWHWNRLFLLTDLIKLSSLTRYFIHGLFSVWCFPVSKRFLLGFLGGMINWFINITEMKKLIIRKFQFCHLMPWSYQLMFVKIVMLNFWYIDKYWF